MAYKPSAQLPVTSPDDPNEAWPNQLQQPIQMRRIVDASQNWFDTNQNADAVAEQIVSYYSSSIENFVGTQRRDYSAGVVQQQSRFLNLPGLTLQYENRQGQERLSMTARPESFTGGGDTELNLDGYIVIVCLGPDFADGTPAQTMNFDLKVNEKSVGSCTFVSNVQAAVVVKFGKTALKCQSLADTDEKGPGNPNQLVGRCTPPRPKTKPYKNVANEEGFAFGGGGIQVPAHDDLFGYFVYNWNDTYNQGMGGSSPGFLAPGNKLNILQTIDADPTVLNNDGLNTFRANLTSPWLAGSVTFFVVESEFYSRTSFRNATGSWTKPPGSGPVLVNDKPLYWGIFSEVAKNIPLNVDFTTKPANTDPPVQTPVQAFTGTSSDGSKPYLNGYWRLGDGWSFYAGQPSDPWGIVYPIVETFYNQLVLLGEFMNNTYQTVPPTVVNVDGSPYTITPIFFTVPGSPITDGAEGAATGAVLGDALGFGPNSAVLAGGAVDAAYSNVYNKVQLMLGTWVANKATAQSKATGQDVFIPDMGALTMLNALVSDLAQLLVLAYGQTTVPDTTPPSASGSPFPTFDWPGSLDPSPFYVWQHLISQSGTQPAKIITEMAGQAGELYVNPVYANSAIQQAQLTFGWSYTELFFADMQSAWDSATNAVPELSTLLNAMVNYTLPAN